MGVNLRTRVRQGHPVDKGGGGRRISGLTYVPLADAISAATFEQVDMDMVFMGTIRARPEDGRKLPASALSQAFAKAAGNLRIREHHHLSVGKPERVDIECIGLAVLGEFRTGNPVAAAAIKGGEILDGLEGGAKLKRSGRRLFAHPIDDGLGHGAAKNSCGRDCYPASVRQDDGFELHYIRRLALTWSCDRR
jgi:hypothetical protein